MEPNRNIWWWLVQDIRYIFYSLQFRFANSDKLKQKDWKKFIHLYPQMEEFIEQLEQFYANNSPKNISVQERKEKKLLLDNTFVYGETPWLTLLSILKEVNHQKNDVFYELGCGTGRICFFLNKCFGLKTVGFDKITYFTSVANMLIKQLNLKDINFINDDFFNHDISEGTIFYMTPTCYSRETMKVLNTKLKECKSGSKIISVSRKLRSPYLQNRRHKIYRFSWYMSEVFFYEVE